MDKRIRSLYVRVLRGKYDKGRGNPEYMRNISAEIEWYYQYSQIREAFSQDEYCPEEIFWGWTSSRMPICYKWARRYTVHGSDEVKATIEKEIEREDKFERERKMREKRLEAAKKVRVLLKRFKDKGKEWLRY